MKFSLGWRAGSMLLGRCEGVGKGEAGVGGGGKGGEGIRAWVYEL